MKKQLLFVLFTLAFSYSGFAQIKQVKTEKSEEIGKVAPGGIKTISCEKQGDTYTIFYRDAKYTQIDEWKSFSFKDIDSAFENLYQLIIDGLESIPEEDILIELPNDFIYLHFEKNLGVKSFQFKHAVDKSDIIGFSPYMTRKQAQKLFGKR